MKKLLVIVGPTATGKTDLALNIAKDFNGELVSADSRQIYRGMDIGTGKIELRSQNMRLEAQHLLTQKSKVKIQKLEGKWLVNEIPIHLYDVIDPDENYSVAQFQQAAYKAIDYIHARNKLPILVGGTGLYIQAVTEGLKIPKAAPDQKLRDKLEKKPTETLLNNLNEVDPVAFEKIDQNNRRRIIRALEVYYTTGETFSSLKTKFKVNFDLLTIGLTTDRQKLYDKADQRIDSWFESGDFENEVRLLLKKYPSALSAFTSLGYQDVIGYLEGRLNLEEAVQRTKFKHHEFIRRQMTWFRKMGSVNWFDTNELSKKSLFSQIKSWLASSASA